MTAVTRAAHCLQQEPARISPCVLWLPAAPSSVKAARTAAQRFLDAAGYVDAEGVVVLIVSELATNAVRAAGVGHSIRLDLSLIVPGRIRISCWDPKPAAPDAVPAAPDELAESGRGLFLIGQLAACWGVLTKQPGKVVWAEVDVLALL